MTPETDAIADAPQMPVPTPIGTRSRSGTPSRRPRSAAVIRAVASDPSVTGKEEAPTLATSERLIVAPSRTIAACSAERLIDPSPPSDQPAGVAAATAMPSASAMIGAPIRGASAPSGHATPATVTAAASPTARDAAGEEIRGWRYSAPSGAS